MKGLQGLIIAAALGIVAAVCNWLYVNRQAAGYERETFVGVKAAAQVNAGDTFEESDLEPVSVPRQYLGDLDKRAVRWADRSTAIGQKATRSYFNDEVLLAQDLTTPAQRNLSEVLGENEAARWVPADPATFVPRHFNPGDLVSFVVPVAGGTSPASRNGTGAPLPALTETIGPFEILALGDRKGQTELLRARGASAGQENKIAIRVKVKGNALDDPAAERLFQLLHQNGYKGVEVMLYSAQMTNDQ
ncbi:MAG TPA: hypothetical protein VML55_18770 [Planctomycetaceae bacterium]|nr:hypothetical protein [Planctomycetaceae bacterium]